MAFAKKQFNLKLEDNFADSLNQICAADDRTLQYKLEQYVKRGIKGDLEQLRIKKESTEALAAFLNGEDELFDFDDVLAEAKSEAEKAGL